jgi:hypothetical protein
MEESLCPFGRAVMAGEAGCTLARRRPRGEQEVVTCASPVAYLDCGMLLQLLRSRARFALRLPGPDALIPHVQSMRLQCGGTLALARELGYDRPRDLHVLVAEAKRRWGDLDNLPFELIVRSLVGWQPRRRSGQEGPGP